MNRLCLSLLLGLAATISLSAAEREIVPLMTGWRFQPGQLTGAERPDFDDSAWESLSLPHNWGWAQAQRGENYLRGPGWYRRELSIRKPKSQRRYFVRFEGA